VAPVQNPHAASEIHHVEPVGSWEFLQLSQHLVCLLLVVLPPPAA
jgi:hypothetical protein